jgi:hypothetical protein
VADIDALDKRITRAWAALILARDNWARCPSMANYKAEQVAGEYVDRLLDERLRAMTAEQVVSQ